MLANKSYDVIVFGQACCDFIFSGIQAPPRPGEELYAQDFQIAGGGSFIVAAAAARLNLRVAMPSPMGTDLLSGLLRATAAQEGIDPGLFMEVDRPCMRLTMVMNYGGERAFLSYSEQALRTEYLAHVDRLVEACNTKVAVFGMGDGPHALGWMRALAARGVKIVLDSSWDEGGLGSQAFARQMELCNYFVPNLAEARRITGKQDTGDVVRHLAGLTRCPVVKLGAEGAAFPGGGGVRYAQNIDFGPAVDTTGAGDNFVAGFSYGLVLGRPLEECVRLGLICGSKSVLAVGGSTASLREEELLALAKETG